MPGCPYFLANTFGHLLGGLTLTGISTEHPIVPDLEKKPITALVGVLFTFALLVAISFSEPGPFKYIAFAFFCLTLGQILSGFVKRLKQEQVLSSTLILVGTIFVSMTVVGFLDKGNMLSLESYLYAGLLGLIVATIGIALFSKPTEAGKLNRWVSWFVVILFTLFVGYDVQILKEHAKQCKSNPDYVQESIDLYLDFLNLFQGVGSLERG